MKKFIKHAALTSVALLIAGQAMAADSTALTTSSQKLSYTIGYEMGSNFNKQNIKIDPSILLKGLSDGLSNQKPALDKDARKATIVEFQKEVIAKEEAKFKKVAVKNTSQGEVFLKANASKPGVKTLANGLQYKVLKAGTGIKPSLSDTVTVNYSGSFIDGKVFDSSYKRGKPATFPLTQVIKGWQDALTKMSVGSEWEVYVPAKLAYGERGMGNVIGPNETLIFKIQLIKVDKKA